MNLFWDYQGSPLERAEVYEWIKINDCSAIEIIGITENVVTAYRADNPVKGFAEMRRDHTGLAAALTAIRTRLDQG